MDLPTHLLLERWFGVSYLVFGLSLMAWAPRWVALLRRGTANPDFPLILGGIPLVIGALLVSGHNIWGWSIPCIVTVLGWLTFVKGFVYLVAPDLAATLLRRFPPAIAWVFFGGLFATLVSLLIMYHSFIRIYQT